MADQDTNGYNDEASDFKRKNNNSNEQDAELDDDQESQQQSQKTQEYIKGMMTERKSIDRKYPIADRLLEMEIENVQKTGKPPARRYIDIYREKNIKVAVKILVPVKEHPRFNFVGKLLGPKGNTLKRLQEETLCKMAIMGRGSMKDRKKEEELRNGMDPKYAHLLDDLHVEVFANGPPPEVYARIAYAMAELRKYLIPDSNDFIRQEQMRELIEDAEGGDIPPKKPFESEDGQEAPSSPPTSVPPRSNPKKKVLSILDKARAAMEDVQEPRTMPGQRYEEPTYEHGYQTGYAYPPGPPPPRAKYAPEAPEYEPEYRREYYREPAPYSAVPKPIGASPNGRPWKPSPYAAPPRGGHPGEEIPNKHHEAMPRYRHAPYSRPAK